MIDLLARDALLVRDARGRVTDVDWAGSICWWSSDYEFVRSNRVTPFVAPRGLGEVTTKLADVKCGRTLVLGWLGTIATGPRHGST